MDNLTHTLIGFSVAEATCPSHAETRATQRLGWAVAGLANNLPDLDLLFSGLIPGKLGYLLHHRGFTHTLVGAIPQGLLLFWLALWFGKRIPLLLSRRQKQWLFFLAFSGPFFHVFMDGLNSYGVYPFWPWDNHWVYGDTLFIVEPWLWLALSLPLLFRVRKTWARICFLGIVVLTLSLAWRLSWIPKDIAFALTGVCLLSIPALRLIKQWRGIAFGGALVVILVFSFVSHTVRKSYLKIVQAKPTRDVILTPAPADPFCWSLISVEEEGEWYRLRKGKFAPFLRVRNASDCSDFGGKRAGIPLEATDQSSDPRLFWQGQYRTRLSVLRNLSEKNCLFFSFLKFSRAPFVREGSSLIAGDLRFNSGKSHFGEIKLDETACPASLPPWEPVRQELTHQVRGY